MRVRVLLLAAVLAASALAGCTGGDDGAGEEPITWRFTDTDGRVHSNGTAAGTPSVFFFMATWCPSCRDLADDMRAIHDGYADQGVDVFSLSWDPDEDEDDLESWKRDYDQPWPHGNDPGLEVASAMDVQSQSSVVILDGESVKARHYGYGEATEDQMSAILDGLLAE